jgi:predicted dehydrogenase
MLRLGVIGLGRRWRKRYRSALLALRDRFQVRALYDQRVTYARAEADLLSCRLAAGPTDLLASEDVEAVLLPDPQWFRLWPIEVACRIGKPVFCGVPLELDDAHAERLHQQVSEHRLPVMMETLPGLAALTIRLREILDTGLGQPQLVICQGASPLGKQRGSGSDRAISDPGFSNLGLPGILPLLNWCASMFGGEPKNILAGGADSGGFTSILLQFGNGRAAQILHRLVPGTRRRLDLEIVADRGTVSLSLPNRIRWMDSEGRHTQTLPRHKPHTVKMLDEFYHVVREGNLPFLSLIETFRALQWLRAAQRSRSEGRRVNLRT